MKPQLILRKIIISSVSIYIVQVLLIIILMFYGFLSKDKSDISIDFLNSSLLINITVITIFINSFFTIKNLYMLTIKKDDHKMFEETMVQLEKLNLTLRSQRHDFMNHLQVVYSLMQLEEYEEANDYIDRIYNDIQKVNATLKTSIPAVNAILQVKQIFGEKKNIKMIINISSSLNDLKLPSWEFCRILGNLIDNSIFALENSKSDKIITIEISDDIKSFYFSVANNGPKIPENIMGKIFEPGFTTKGNLGDGMGLAITREILNSCGGNIIVSSNDKKTIFSGCIPKDFEVLNKEKDIGED